MICYELIEAIFEDVRANVNFVMNLIASCWKKTNIKLIDDLDVEKNSSDADLNIFQGFQKL